MNPDKQPLSSQQLETLGRVAPAIAHDINNLLSGILGYSQIIISDPSSGGMKSYAEEIEKAGKRISGLVRLLQVFNQNQLFHEELLDINRIIQEMEKYLSKILGEDILLSIQKTPELWLIRADKLRIRQILLLWFNQLLELLPQGGHVLLTTENFVFASKSPEMEAACKPEVKICTEVAGFPNHHSFIAHLSNETEVMSGSMQKMEPAPIRLVEMIHLCGGRIACTPGKEDVVSIDFYFPAETNASTD